MSDFAAQVATEIARINAEIDAAVAEVSRLSTFVREMSKRGALLIEVAGVYGVGDLPRLAEPDEDFAELDTHIGEGPDSESDMEGTVALATVIEAGQIAELIGAPDLPPTDLRPPAHRAMHMAAIGRMAEPPRKVPDQRGQHWTAEDDTQLRRLKGEKLTDQEIAKLMGRTWRSVNQRWLRIKDKPLAASERAPWTVTDDQTVWAMHMRGESDERIAEQLGRLPRFIAYRLKMMREKFRAGRWPPQDATAPAPWLQPTVGMEIPREAPADSAPDGTVPHLAPGHPIEVPATGHWPLPEPLEVPAPEEPKGLSPDIARLLRPPPDASLIDRDAGPVARDFDPEEMLGDAPVWNPAADLILVQGLIEDGEIGPIAARLKRSQTECLARFDELVPSQGRTGLHEGLKRAREAFRSWAPSYDEGIAAE